ncbi:MAG: YSC84-related protein [Gammaproteobacteria bacterium]
MLSQITRTIAMFTLLLVSAGAAADEYATATDAFRKAGESSRFFSRSYGYAVFPSIGKGGFGIGGARGKGRVYEQGAHVGDTTMTQVTIGFQLGGQVYSQIIFFEDKRAFDEFAAGNFEFGAQASAVAITVSASAGASTTGASAGTSGTNDNPNNASTQFYKGMMVFTLAKGGLMYEASIGGQKFSYRGR